MHILQSDSVSLSAKCSPGFSALVYRSFQPRDHHFQYGSRDRVDYVHSVYLWRFCGSRANTCAATRIRTVSVQPDPKKSDVRYSADGTRVYSPSGDTPEARKILCQTYRMEHHNCILFITECFRTISREGEAQIRYPSGIRQPAQLPCQAEATAAQDINWDAETFWAGFSLALCED